MRARSARPRQLSRRRLPLAEKSAIGNVPSIVSEVDARESQEGGSSGMSGATGAFHVPLLSSFPSKSGAVRAPGVRRLKERRAQETPPTSPPGLLPDWAGLAIGLPPKLGVVGKAPESGVLKPEAARGTSFINGDAHPAVTSETVWRRCRLCRASLRIRSCCFWLKSPGLAKQESGEGIEISGDEGIEAV